MEIHLDSPSASRPHRLYIALTNHCNRDCPWCSTYSSPLGKSFISVKAVASLLPANGPFEVQLEGGEPTTHPELETIVALLRREPRCVKIVLSTNGVLLPKTKSSLIPWIESFGPAFTLKLSMNHYLLDRDSGLVELATLLAECFDELGGGRLFVLNVRLRKGVPENDTRILELVRDAGLEPHANIFFLQRIGRASDMPDWENPFLVGTNFTMINPDGRIIGQDLLARSEAMRILP